MTEASVWATNLVAAFAVQAAGQIDAEATSAVGRPSTDTVALVALHRALDGASQEMLAAILGLTSSGAVRLVNRLVGQGLVVREHRDGRTTALRLTPDGDRLAAEALAARFAAVHRLMQHLDDAEQQQLATLVGRMLAGLTSDGADPNRICRMCDLAVCHDRDQCPVTEVARSLSPSDRSAAT